MPAPEDDWSDPERAYSDGNGYAYERNGERHRYYNFNLNIPANSTINGIEARVDAWSSDNSGCRIGVDLSWDGGASWSNEKTRNLTGSEATGTLGDSNDGWGSHAWQVSDFSNANFRARVRDVDPGGSCNNDATTYLDWLRIKVYYTPCVDNDQDGYYAGDGSCGPIDCNDSDATVFPGASEICDGKDNNCNGTIDEGCDCVNDSERACGDTPIVGICHQGIQVCSNGTWGECSEVVYPGEEICTGGLDEDCDGLTDCDDTTDCSQDTNCQIVLPTNGGWTDWNACSAECGGGTQNRTCDNPTPANGGADCSLLDGGNSSRSCNEQSCGGGGSAVISGGGGGGPLGGHVVRCGDGIRELTEQCDDGNIVDGDGCSSTCMLEQVAGASTENTEGEVLGASTDLPTTGEESLLVIFAGLILALGSALGIKNLQ